MEETKYVVSVDQPSKKRMYVFASSSLEKCRDYIQRKYRGCRLMTRSTDKENDEYLIEKYVQVFKRTMYDKILIIIRINVVYIDDEIKEEFVHEH